MGKKFNLAAKCFSRHVNLWTCTSCLAVILVLKLIYEMYNPKINEFFPGPRYKMSKPKVILLAFAMDEFFQYQDAHQFVSNHYRKLDSRCSYITNKDGYNTSDVTIFGRRSLSRKLPKKLKNQKWIFFTDEAPTHFVEKIGKYHQLSRHRRSFDLISTYSVHSDIPLPRSNFYPNIEQPSAADIDYTKGKTKVAAWFVSHCHTPSKREDLVTELAKHMEIDVYGKCGENTCPKHNSKRCDHELSKNYYFYLALENGLCEEYYTEKVWNIYQKDIKVVPVVMGGGNYSEFLPPGTYINVADFAAGDLQQTAKNLSNYLMEQKGDSTSYNKYISERYKFTYETRYARKISYLRNLCSFFQDRNLSDLKQKDLEKIWTGRRAVESHCVTQKQYFKSKSVDLHMPDIDFDYDLV